MKFSLEFLEQFSTNDFLIKTLLSYLKNISKKAEDLDLYDEAYYNNSESLISDTDYDRLKKTFKEEIFVVKKLLVKLEKTTFSPEIIPYLKEIKTIIKKREGKVGSKPREGFKKFPHTRPMLSLNNLFEVEEIDPWLSKFEAQEILCELKIDGISFSAFYSGGKLVRGLTRGDGKIGEDITNNLKAIQSLPQIVDYKGDLEVRGEVYLDKETFAWLQTTETFSNPRNAASGSLRQLDPSVTAYRRLQYFIWDLFGPPMKTQAEKLFLAEKLNFSVNNLRNIATTSRDIVEFYNQILTKRPDLNYEIDGLVYKINDVAVQEELGFTSSAPRWAVAHKCPAEEAVTTIRAIRVQVGKSGVITPLAEVEPITLGGATISRVTLHNAREVAIKDYKIGDKILLIRSGDVIPKVVKTIQSSDNSTFIFPKNCPICNSKLQDDTNFVNKICPAGWDCFGQRLEKLLHFVSRNAFNILGLGEKQLTYLINEGLVLTYSDLFNLKEKNKQLEVPLEERRNWGKKSVELLFQNLDKAREISFDKFLYALAIPLVGQEIARLLADRYEYYEACISIFTRNNAVEELEIIPGIGQQIAQSIIEFFTTANNIMLINDLLKHIVIRNKVAVYKLEEFYFTGTLNNYTRQEASDLVAKFNYKVATSLNSKVKFLVVGSAPSLTKLDKAKKMGIITLTEEEFLQRFI